MDNVNLLPENEYKEVEGRRYLNPNLPVTETEDFITKFRDTQRGNTQEISQQTQALGTEVPSNLGGLTGANSYFTSRYQTPQTNSATQQLRTAAQASALNQAMANEEAMWKKRYQDAYRAYQKRQNDKTNQNLGGGDEDEPEFTDSSLVIEGVTPGVPDGHTVADIDTENGTVLGYTGVPYGEEGQTSYQYREPRYYTYLGSGARATTNYKDASGHWVMEYQLPSGAKATTRMGEELKQGDDGNFYVYNKSNNSYTYVGR